jgi:hypothetical protein
MTTIEAVGKTISFGVTFVDRDERSGIGDSCGWGT